MTLRFPFIICAAFTLMVSHTYLDANSRALGLASRRASGIETKRVEKKVWSQPQANSMMDKSFPIKEWDKHFSSVGSKRSPISLTEQKEKQMFKTKTWESKDVSFDMSRWNEQMADLHKKAGIELDERAQLVADQQLYYMMTQDSEEFRSMAEDVSLRDLNRYQFRRNRSDGAVPVERAGSEQ